MYKRLVLSVTAMLFVCVSFSQNQGHREGELIVWLKKEATAEKLCADLPQYKNSAAGFAPKKLLSKRLNIWLMEFNPQAVHEKEILSAVKGKSEVQAAQFNHRVTLRSKTPDDPLFIQQFDMLNTGQTGGTMDADIDAELAWDTVTGGKTVLGDTIVVAIIDDGIEDTHDDMKENLWVNYGEIPNNNIDDDGNGYIDDYRGWNVYSNDDDITDGGWGGWHGTSVAGIVGAKGNNGIGVTGVNWNVKLMIIAGSSTNEADVVAAYDYVLENRALYNSTNGAKGAFVVATNSSFGVDLGQPADYPVWCAMYDSMGKYGILSAGATANADFDIDTQGDIPTACPSDFLIAVTNTSYQDKKISSAGYGLTTIDLGAPGENAYTVEINNGYGAFGGTSGATPHVAGSIALLYAAACESTMQFCKSKPDSGALLIKNYILNGVDAIADLQGKTVTGGRLNVFNSMLLLRQNGGGICPTDKLTSLDELAAKNKDDQIARIFPNPAHKTLNVEYFSNAPLKISVSNLLGKELISVIEHGTVSRKKEINISELAPGIYLLNIYPENQQPETVKLVVF